MLNAIWCLVGIGNVISVDWDVARSQCRVIASVY